jgi:serine/threonine-protein kinase
VALGLATTLRDLDRADTAAVLMREVLEAYRREPGPESDEYMAALGALAFVLRATDDYDEAERLYRELIGRRRERGGSLAQLAPDLNNLAFLLRLRGEFSEAAELYRESLEILEPIFGRGHPNSLVVANNLSAVLVYAGAFAAADSIRQESVRAAEERWPVGHWRIGSQYLGLGVGRASAGDYAGARAPLLEAARIYETALGPTHFRTASAWLWYAAVASLRGDTEEAETLFETSFTTLRVQVESKGLLSWERTALGFAYEFMVDRGLAEAAELRAILDSASAPSG